MKLRSLFAAVAMTTIAAPVLAQDNSALATELFNAGRDLMNAGKIAEACPKLAESARLDVKVGTLAKLAECEEKSNHLAAARGRWQQALNIAKTQNDPRLSKVEEEFARIDKLVTKINLTATWQVPPDLAIKIDTLAFNASTIGIAIPVDTGHHVISVSAAGRMPWTKELDVTADGVTLEVPIPELAVDNRPPPPPPVDPNQPQQPAEKPHKETSSSPIKTLGFVTAIVGGVTTGVGLGLGFQAKTWNDDSNGKNGCVGNVCTPEGARVREDAISMGNTATVVTVVGLVLVAGGIIMVAAAPSGSSSSSSSASLKSKLLRGQF